jgi:cellulose synthase/poly-beta-1,6-N-acetylglucosamine synthase-like glycosyltransferase
MIDLMQAVVVAAVVAVSFRRAVFLVGALLPPRRIPPRGVTPSVSVIVPARNEAAVAGRLLEALAHLEYPPDRLAFVLVCDGCSDDTPLLFRAWAAGRTDTRLVEFPQRVGKAAALNAGLRLAEAELVTVIDADLAPGPSFLLELVRPLADVDVGAAAAYLRPANADANIVTRYAAVTTWVHQLVTSAGNDRLGLNPPTLGAAAFRRAALIEIGGFPDMPVGVDVAASAGLTSAGWRTRFVASAVIDNTVASSIRDYWRQHVRWSRGAFRANGPGVRGRSTAPLQRLESAVAAMGYADRLVFFVALLGALAGALPAWIPLVYVAVPGLEIVAALVRAGIGRRLVRFLLATVLLFPVDVIGSISAVVAHVARRPYRWHSPRHAPAEEPSA